MWHIELVKNKYESLEDLYPIVRKWFRDLYNWDLE